MIIVDQVSTALMASIIIVLLELIVRVVARQKKAIVYRVQNMESAQK